MSDAAKPTLKDLEADADGASEKYSVEKHLKIDNADTRQSEEVGPDNGLKRAEALRDAKLNEISHLGPWKKRFHPKKGFQKVLIFAKILIPSSQRRI